MTLEYSGGLLGRPAVLMWLSLAVSLLSISVAGGVLIYAADEPKVNGFTVWVVSPFVGLAAFAYMARGFRAASIVVLIAVALATALVGLELYDFFTSKSSTGALVFLAIPVCQWVIAAVAGVTGLVIRMWRSHSAPAK